MIMDLLHLVYGADQEIKRGKDNIHSQYGHNRSIHVAPAMMPCHRSRSSLFYPLASSFIQSRPTILQHEGIYVTSRLSSLQCSHCGRTPDLVCYNQ